MSSRSRTVQLAVLSTMELSQWNLTHVLHRCRYYRAYANAHLKLLFCFEESTVALKEYISNSFSCTNTVINVAIF